MRNAAAGFTGTSQGMTEPQKERFADIVLGWGELHEGDCVGADDEAARIAKGLGLWIASHPPDNPKMRAFFPDFDEEFPEKPYLLRNRMIVDTTKILIAAPKEFSEAMRSGTWATVRYARRQRRPIIYLWPDGRQTRAN